MNESPPRRIGKRSNVAMRLVCLAAGLFLAVLWLHGVRLDSELGTRVARYCPRVVRVLPHDPQAFTQGLFYAQGSLYESTGLQGRSSLRRVNLDSGRVEHSRALASPHFGEGIALLDGKIYQLTWRSRIGFVYDLERFDLLATFTYSGEGWGLTQDGTHLILSDGSSTLYFLDPTTFQTIREVAVRDGSKPITNLNELEFAQGKIYANVWQSDRIAVIDPESGRVEAWGDLSGLLPAEDRNGPVDVLNGIAFDPGSGRFWVTGKLWPKVFEIEWVTCR